MATRRKEAKKQPNEARNKNPEEPSDASNAVDSERQEQQERLDRELIWCVEQLRLGIASKNSSDKQIAEAVRVLRMLESTSTPAPKKRMLMKSTFGDYRKKMADELQHIDAKSKSDRSKISVKPASLTHQHKSTFYRRSNAASSSSSSVASTAERFHCDTAAMCCSSDAGEYMFNFPTDAAGGSRDSNTSSETSSDTIRGTSKATSSVTDSRVDDTCCAKDMTSPSSDLISTNSTLSFSTSADGTPFLFNFDSVDDS